MKNRETMAKDGRRSVVGFLVFFFAVTCYAIQASDADDNDLGICIRECLQSVFPPNRSFITSGSFEHQTVP
ncbi:hypothetical protein RvY_16294 [Ramazzottius varieornatus]|uniref:Uncharacterized protein n=1 Tax=Ramazzottius varieornatus TaxID=947166 RepID=A0A1D1VXW8_RAMVA|nr:hypothetical protein RvY_16294 [Ramazzottius varieornatus]